MSSILPKNNSKSENYNSPPIDQHKWHHPCSCVTYAESLPASKTFKGQYILSRPKQFNCNAGGWKGTVWLHPNTDNA